MNAIKISTIYFMISILFCLIVGCHEEKGSSILHVPDSARVWLDSLWSHSNYLDVEYHAAINPDFGEQYEGNQSSWNDKSWESKREYLPINFISELYSGDDHYFTIYRSFSQYKWGWEDMVEADSEETLTGLAERNYYNAGSITSEYYIEYQRRMAGN